MKGDQGTGEWPPDVSSLSAVQGRSSAGGQEIGFAPLAVLVVAAFFLAFIPSRTEAQSLTDAVSAALSNQCRALGGVFGSFGPNLDRVCFPPTIPPGGGAPPFTAGLAGQAGGGSITQQVRLGEIGEDRRIRERAKEVRERLAGISGLGAQAASSDGALGGFSIFVSGDYELFKKDVTSFEPGFISHIKRGAVGGDYSFSNRRLVLGGAFKFARDDGNFKNGGGDFTTEEFGGLVYGSLIPVANLFVDVIVGYAGKNLSANRQILFTGNDTVGGAPRVTVTSGAASNDTDGDEFTASVQGGYDFRFGNFTIGPRGGLAYRHLTVDPFAERGQGGVTCVGPTPGSIAVCVQSGATGLELAYDRQSRSFLTSTLGAYASLAISTGIGVLVPQATFEYFHEFQGAQRTINFRLVEDLRGTKLSFKTDPPEHDYFNLSVGMVAVLPRGFSPFVNYRVLLGYKARESHTGTIGLRYEF